MMHQSKSAYDMIGSIKVRHGMYTEDKDLSVVATLLHGYVTCLRFHSIKEDIEGRQFCPMEFGQWLNKEKGWSTCLGFAYAIEENTPDRDAAFEMFFELVEQYRYGSVD